METSNAQSLIDEAWRLRSVEQSKLAFVAAGLLVRALMKLDYSKATKETLMTLDIAILAISQILPPTHDVATTTATRAQRCTSMALDDLLKQVEKGGMVMSERATDLTTTRERVVLLLDTSGSMGCRWPGQPKLKLHYAVEAVDAIVDVSDPDLTDYALVDFNSDVRLRAPFGAGFLGVLAGSKRLRDAGCTNLARGLALALEQQPSRVVLLTDGQPDSKDAAFVVVDTAANLGVKVDCVGIGDADEVFLKEICKRTGGKYSFSTTPEQLFQTFEQLESRAYLQLEYVQA